MAIFGELIESEVPVLICFYTPWYEDQSDLPDVLRTVSVEIADKGRVIKIDMDKNETLVKSLRIKGHYPTYFIYRDGDMKWRQTGGYCSDLLIKLLQEYERRN